MQMQLPGSTPLAELAEIVKNQIKVSPPAPSFTMPWNKIIPGDPKSYPEEGTTVLLYCPSLRLLGRFLGYLMYDEKTHQPIFIDQDVDVISAQFPVEYWQVLDDLPDGGDDPKYRYIPVKSE